MSIYAWGSNNKGQLGDNTKIVKLIPTQIGTKNWKQVDCGDSHTVAIDFIFNNDWKKQLVIRNQSFVGRSNRDII